MRSDEARRARGAGRRDGPAPRRSSSRSYRSPPPSSHATTAWPTRAPARSSRACSSARSSRPAGRSVAHRLPTASVRTGLNGSESDVHMPCGAPLCGKW